MVHWTNLWKSGRQRRMLAIGCCGIVLAFGVAVTGAYADSFDLMANSGSLPSTVVYATVTLTLTGPHTVQFTITPVEGLTGIPDSYVKDFFF